jgi:hypothetical protein
VLAFCTDYCTLVSVLYSIDEEREREVTLLEEVILIAKL